ncbi:protein phosphatase 1H [Drosophila albomicans]|uniref:Protein phosphatase 1H n=1 Tax=Drosophila albomicans TaxID=7291 RepID=A0A6P8Y7F8_DROAB|nr:protein phosphatase 1H [Drosophila albomicans]
MLNSFKASIMSAISPDLPPPPNGRNGEKFRYSRPLFLELLSEDELRASSDHNIRPIIVPRDISLLPWGTGYAECVNSGKSRRNEDQAAFRRQVLSDPNRIHPDLPYTYFGIFDGHAGYGAALAASYQLSLILHEKLVDCIELLLPRDAVNGDERVAAINPAFPHPKIFERSVTKDELIIGALEAAFFDMDELVDHDNSRYRDAGGCTACVVLFINGKMYVANAGDSRAVLCQRRSAAPKNPNSTAADGDGNGNEKTEKIEPDPVDDTLSYATPFSFDHTPETERIRLENVARLRPELIESYYVAMEYAKRPQEKNLGQRVLCRKGTMKGWTYKTVTSRDLAMPVVNGEGKRSRLLGTLGVTRGFGDHRLKAINRQIPIKPFLTPHPDVRIRDLSQVVSIPDEHNEDGDYGVLVMATDGLWDVSENEAVARTVFQTLTRYPQEKHRYTMAAQELVARARGKVNDSGHWRLADSKAAATVDDISVIVIPVYQYYKEHVEWTQTCAQRKLAQQNNTQKKVEVEQQVPNEAIVEVEESIVVEVDEKTPLEAHVESVSETLQQVQLEASGEPEKLDKENNSSAAETSATTTAGKATGTTTGTAADNGNGPTKGGTTNAMPAKQRNNNKKK